MREHILLCGRALVVALLIIISGVRVVGRALVVALLIIIIGGVPSYMKKLRWWCRFVSSSSTRAFTDIIIIIMARARVAARGII